ncbi:hypothetical protein [Bradyrhizobium sp. 170]|uniref:hypothetical protein n=1 Tax=Bradyrhizobium sp. 170 TaxID=2782641 RepID=UPI001FFFEB50|nr:hypothetical protein [Bradyrhizobium sp. 170]UPK02878.1 hypothetical protein IVB05_35830 [Bradyrhizobium sp. 170]
MNTAFMRTQPPISVAIQLFSKILPITKVIATGFCWSGMACLLLRGKMTTAALRLAPGAGRQLRYWPAGGSMAAHPNKEFNEGALVTNFGCAQQ